MKRTQHPGDSDSRDDVHLSLTQHSHESYHGVDEIDGGITILIVNRLLVVDHVLDAS
jgi:hypothetical protein